MTKAVLSILLAIVFTYVGVVGFLYFPQRRLSYFPDTEKPFPRNHGVPEMQAVDIDGAAGRLTFWHGPAQPGRPTLVLFHGNAGHHGDRAFKARAFFSAGFGVVLAAYRGYGGNPGSPTEDGLYEDARDILDWMTGQGIAAAHTVLYGESLGSGVAMQMAVEDRGAILVLEAPYTSLPDTAAHHYPWAPVRLLMKDKFESLAKIGRLRLPLFIAHGKRDGTVPYAMGERLYDAAPGAKEMFGVAGAGHNDIFQHDVAPRVITFVDRYLSR